MIAIYTEHKSTAYDNVTANKTVEKSHLRLHWPLFSWCYLFTVANSSLLLQPCRHNWFSNFTFTFSR